MVSCIASPAVEASTSKSAKNLPTENSCLKSRGKIATGKSRHKQVRVNDDADIVMLSANMLDFGNTYGYKPSDDAERSECRKQKEPATLLDILISEAHAIAKAKLLTMDIVKTNDQIFEDVEDHVEPKWPCVWWEDIAYCFHPNDVFLPWNTKFGRRQIEEIYSTHRQIDCKYVYNAFDI